MERLIQTIVDGIATGSLYGALALAVVLIFRTTGIVNFAQGEMAMFSTFVAWGLIEAGLPLGAALALTLLLSFIGGMVIERVVIRPVEGGEPLVLVIVKLGLAMRAVAMNAESSRLSGIPVGRTLMVGWGLAALVGALAGALIAPRLFLDVNFMGGVLIYAFAAATLGGFDSPIGAVVGGWIIGVAENLAGTYVDFIGSDLKIL